MSRQHEVRMEELRNHTRELQSNSMQLNGMFALGMMNMMGIAVPQAMQNTLTPIFGEQQVPRGAARLPAPTGHVVGEPCQYCLANGRENAALTHTTANCRHLPQL